MIQDIRDLGAIVHHLEHLRGCQRSWETAVLGLQNIFFAIRAFKIHTPDDPCKQYLLTFAYIAMSSKFDYGAHVMKF